MQIRLAGYISESIVDGPGIRSVIFTQGCLHHCKNCHNPSTHPLEKGKVLEIEEVLSLISNNPLSVGITVSGGEPFLQPEAINELIKLYKNKHPNKNIVIYTGYTIEELLNFNNPVIKEILLKTEILIDGKYQDSLRDLTLFYRGSSNQRVIDVQKTFQTGKICLSKYQTMKS